MFFNYCTKSSDARAPVFNHTDRTNFLAPPYSLGWTSWLTCFYTDWSRSQSAWRKEVYFHVFTIYYSVFWKVSVCALIGRVDERPIYITGKKANLWGWICYQHAQKIQIINNYRNHVFLGEWEGSANKGVCHQTCWPRTCMMGEKRLSEVFLRSPHTLAHSLTGIHTMCLLTRWLSTKTTLIRIALSSQTSGPHPFSET